jgi:predicted dehydrogenase
MINQTIRVGFVGAGANTREHHIQKLRAQPGVELVAVANRTKESGERVAREFGIPRGVRRLARSRAGAGRRRGLHRHLALRALRDCEARMAMDAAEARRMLDGARRSPHLITQLVPAPNTLEVNATLQRLVAEGYIGEAIASSWRVEEEFVSALRGHEKITRTTFEDGVRYMEFTDAVARSAANG